MIAKGANEVADILLYGLGDPAPQWKKLARPVKQQLMKRLGEKNYNNIHDPRLYEDLDRLWKEKKETKEKDIIDRMKLVTKVDCAVCLETYDCNDSVTTLMCGHKFCSKCVFEHIHRLGESACCPLCRRNVFDILPPLIVPTTRVIYTGRDTQQQVVYGEVVLMRDTVDRMQRISEDIVDRLRRKRQLQRKKKRERKRQKDI
jgi:hypothetical protein